MYSFSNIVIAILVMVTVTVLRLLFCFVLRVVTAHSETHAHTTPRAYHPHPPMSMWQARILHTAYAYMPSIQRIKYQ